MKKIVLIASLLAAHSLVSAQTFEGNVSGFETPMGMNSVTDIDSPVATRRDSNFNRTVVNSTGGAGFSATSIGNLISVENAGSNNTVVINATQVNNGAQNATLGSTGF
jgi:holdfast attachment protein HfaA